MYIFNKDGKEVAGSVHGQFRFNSHCLTEVHLKELANLFLEIHKSFSDISFFLHNLIRCMWKTWDFSSL